MPIFISRGRHEIAGEMDSMNQWHIGEILIQKKLIDWKQLEEALNEQKRTHEFVEVLVRKQYVPKYLLFRRLQSVTQCRSWT